jgi:hypothetical protein
LRDNDSTLRTVPAERGINFILLSDAMGESAHKTFARLLKWHGIGHALYSPVTADRVRPGTIGYFDNGSWNALPVAPFDSSEIRLVTEGPRGRSPMTSQSIQKYGATLNLSFEYAASMYVLTFEVLYSLDFPRALGQLSTTSLILGMGRFSCVTRLPRNGSNRASRN